MRYFVTGASGFVGSAVVPELLAHGHQVVGLARSDDAAAAVESLGAEVVRGGLGDIDLLTHTARDTDGVVHLAFRHDIAFTGDFAGAAASDRAAIDAFGAALAGTGKPLVIASGLVGLTPGRTSTELDPAQASTNPRAANEVAALALAGDGVRASSVRLAPTVHGEGDGGFLAAIIGAARQNGTAGYLAGGRWPAVHRSDAAVLFRLAVEQAPAGSVLHGCAEQGVALSDVAEVIARHLDVPVAEVSPDDAAAHFGFLAGFLGMDASASSTITRDLLDWTPSGPGLIEDLDAGHYFAR